MKEVSIGELLEIVEKTKARAEKKAEKKFLKVINSIYEGKIEYDNLSNDLKDNIYIIEAFLLSGRMKYASLCDEYKHNAYLVESLASAGIILPEDLPEDFQMTEKVEVAFGLKEIDENEKNDELEPEYCGYEEYKDSVVL